ncbi:MAG: fmt, methionyl-tRNA formyltransferase [Candidatus Saccharibacteria bacterium]|nr:fmt, methionyl-tRNA formyltransferase [Candidatus Saccharibacteria bacterium]
MKKMSETIVFFGSGPVAAEALQCLNEDFVIEAVVTKPVPPHHRGDFPVLSLAKKLGLQVYTPSNKQELSELFLTKPVQSKLGIVIDYGIIISRDVIDYFPLGIVNSHFSLLPRWRGADPITAAILHGDSETGISLMLIDEKLDEGELLAQAPYEISSPLTTPQLTKDLIELSHQTLVAVVPDYVAGHITPAPQEQVSIALLDSPTYSRKLTKEDGVIDWQKPAQQIEREIRAYIDWPKSRTQLGGIDVIITAAKVIELTGEPGKPVIQGKKLILPCGKQALQIIKLKPAGKQEMTAEAFLAGYNL